MPAAPTMNGPKDAPEPPDDYVVVPPKAAPQYVHFAPPRRSADQEARPLRIAMFWIVLLVSLGLAWSTCTGEGEPERRAPRPLPSGTTTL